MACKALPVSTLVQALGQKAFHPTSVQYAYTFVCQELCSAVLKLSETCLLAVVFQS